MNEHPRPSPLRRPPAKRVLLRALAILAILALVAVPGEAFAQQGIVFRLPYLGQTSFSFTNTTIATYRNDNFDQNQFDNNFLALTERFDSQLTAAPWRLQLRIDGFVPIFNRAIPTETTTWAGMPGNPQYTGCRPPWCTDYLHWDLRLERIALRYQRNGITVEAGDVYTVIGRGVAMAFRKVDPLGLDTVIRGGRAELELDRFTFRAFGGYVNPQNLDPITLQVNHDWGNAIAGGDTTLRAGPDIIGGGEGAARIGPDEDVEVGVHALRLHAAEAVGKDFDVDVYGMRVQAPTLLDGALTLHFELDGLRRQASYFRVGRDMMGANVRAGETREEVTYGRAIFGAVQFVRGNFNALVEWKDYTNYLLSPSGGGADPRRIYSAAPSLERDDVQLRTNSNARGGRVRLEYAFRPSPWIANVTFVSNGNSEANDHDPWDGAAGAVGVTHGYLTIRRRSRIAPAATDSVPHAGAMGGLGTGAPRVTAGDWQVTGSVGYRREWMLGEPHMLHTGQVDALDWQYWHADMDLQFAMGPQDSLEMRIDVAAHNRWNSDPSVGDYYWYTRSGIAVTWAHGIRWNFSAVLRYDTFYAQQGKQTYDVHPDGTVSADRYPEWYPAGEVRWMFMSGSTLRLFGGMTPGGRLCTGGVCRDVPPFAGGMLELVLRI
jgi:hypothetical protein